MIDRKPIIGVMGSHEREWREYSEAVGKLIADHDYHLLTGAGGGVMMATARAFMSVPNRAGVSLGIVPTMNYDGSLVPHEQYPNSYIEIPIITPLDNKAQGDAMPYSRNYVNIMTSHAVVILPGEHGAQNEASLAIHFKKPTIYFGPEEEFARFPEKHTHAETIDEIREFLEQATAKIKTGEDG